jgi:hypothetical protein
MQGALWTGLPLIGALLGNLEGVHLPGLLREKKGYLSSFLDPEVIKILSLSEALASLRHTYLGSFFLDPEDIRRWRNKHIIYMFVCEYSANPSYNGR